MTVGEIRQVFFNFFKDKNHEWVESAPMVIKNDPTLLFTNAGMNQFKDYFLGNEIPKARRVVNSQKCLRVSGKHNDLEEVGVDTYHHTMFEMLGNWSFGDYFKPEAIHYAWELLTKVYELDKDRLYVTVFEGNKKDKLNEDYESIKIWKKYVPEERILLCSKKDNFWEMGETGPCGPCSEIHIDLRADNERDKILGKELVNKDHPQVIEIWNIVFVQFDRKSDGSLVKLPETHVDTGMGLERLAMALQGKQSNYDIDLFQVLIKKIEEISSVKYGFSEKTDIAMRVIADHIRTICFSIAEGQLPANNGAGYVIRRILRRAVRYGYQSLDLKESFLANLSKVLVDLMKNPFLELEQNKELIFKVIKDEENSFYRTLSTGITRINDLIATLKSNNKKMIDGSAIFELYDTYGFPIDVTSLIAKEQGVSLDIEGFEKELFTQKNRSRKATAIKTEDWIDIYKNEQCKFVGYDKTTCSVRIIRYRKVQQKQNDFFQLVLNETPFYPEGGGQVGDSGLLTNDTAKIEVFDTKKENNLILHYTKSIPADLTKEFSAEVNMTKRIPTSYNHSATHLLHHALRDVLGEHVEQKGSLVNSTQLRFDFSHFNKISEDELNKIESHVNNSIKANLELIEHRSTSIEKAKEMGAMALFGEKYGEKVRVIKFGKSVELCGGIHVENSAQIGLFKIVSESAIASGIRRIEAISGPVAENYFKEKVNTLITIEKLLKKPKNIVATIQELQNKNSALQKEVELLLKEKARHMKRGLKDEITKINGISFLCTTLEMESSLVRNILFQLKGEIENFIGIIGNITDQKCGISMIIDEKLVEKMNLNAGQLIREAAIFIKGGGGGQKFYASAGGKDKNGIPTAIQSIKDKVIN